MTAHESKPAKTKKPTKASTHLAKVLGALADARRNDTEADLAKLAGPGIKVAAFETIGGPRQIVVCVDEPRTEKLEAWGVLVDSTSVEEVVSLRKVFAEPGTSVHLPGIEREIWFDPDAGACGSIKVGQRA